MVGQWSYRWIFPKAPKIDALNLGERNPADIWGVECPSGDDY